jgi:cytochrome c biogenesis protein CcmG/thiol:disulfide interchange protein DsbE
LADLDAAVAADDAAAVPPRRFAAPIVVGAVAVVMVGLFWILASAKTTVDETADSPLLGNPAPAVSGTGADGSTFDLSRRRGSWVVLNFFTHNCVPCIREHPELVRFVDQQRRLGLQGAEFYSVVQHSSREQVEAFFAERGGDWPIVYDDRYEFQNGFGVAQVPETWIIDDNGFVRARIISEVTADGLSTYIQRLREAAP